MQWTSRLRHWWEQSFRVFVAYENVDTSDVVENVPSFFKDLKAQKGFL